MEWDALIYVNQDLKIVEIVIGESQFYLEWAPGQGADIGWYRANDDNRIVGCCIPFDGESICVRGLGSSIQIDSQRRLREQSEKIAKAIFGDGPRSGDGQ